MKPNTMNPRTADLVNRFAAAVKEKLAAAEKKYGYSDGWAHPDWMDECREHLREHVAKGDPRDVAAYCAFLWHHGQSTAPTREEQMNNQRLPALDCDDNEKSLGWHALNYRTAHTAHAQEMYEALERFVRGHVIAAVMADRKSTSGTD